MPTLPLHRIPVQTGANCALFAVISAARFLGCDEATEIALISQLDRLEKTDGRTFIGEVLSINLLLDLIGGVTLAGAPLFSARSVAFYTPTDLLAIVQESTQTGSALLVPFARPPSYDTYYRLLGQQSTISTAAVDLQAVHTAKEAESQFLPADAHWALLNRVGEMGRMHLADSFEDIWGRGHGYEVEFTAEKLTTANLALDGCFDWSTFLDEQGRAWGIQDVWGKPYTPSAPRTKNPERLETILRNQWQEDMDLAGRLVILEKIT